MLWTKFYELKSDFEFHVSFESKFDSFFSLFISLSVCSHWIGSFFVGSKNIENDVETRVNEQNKHLFSLFVRRTSRNCFINAHQNRIRYIIQWLALCNNVSQSSTTYSKYIQNQLFFLKKKKNTAKKENKATVSHFHKVCSVFTYFLHSNDK